MTCLGSGLQIPLYSGTVVKDLVKMTRNLLLKWKVNKGCVGEILVAGGVAGLGMWESDS